MPTVARLEHGGDAGPDGWGGAGRSSHAKWEPAAGREDPIAILSREAEARVAELPSIRCGRIAAWPFDFYRGAAAVMAARFGDRLAIVAYLGEGERFEAAIAECPRRFADRSEADHARPPA